MTRNVSRRRFVQSTLAGVSRDGEVETGYPL
jgi:hypothetical protein